MSEFKKVSWAEWARAESKLDKQREEAQIAFAECDVSQYNIIEVENPPMPRMKNNKYWS